MVTVRNWLCCALLSLVLTVQISFADNANTTLLLDAKNSPTIAPAFRSSDKDAAAVATHSTVSVLGLDNLHIAGSSQFSADGLKQAIKILPKPIIVVDLRQESHGFINGNAVSWVGIHNLANFGKSDQAINDTENSLLAALSKLSKTPVATHYSVATSVITDSNHMRSLKVKDVMSEQQLAQIDGVGYKRLPVPDSQSPNDQVVDSFVAFVSTLPSSTTLYFHCHDGQGRTTMFMAMDDMMHNAKHVSFKDILSRQAILGGSSLFPYNPTSFQYPYAKKRLAFLHKFYNYCRENNDNFKTSWSMWLKTNQGNSDQLDS